MQEDVHYLITNVVGNKVKDIFATTNAPVSAQLNRAGIYFVSAYTAHGNWEKKIVVTGE